ncbi:MAG: hypothetical protein DRN96_05765 [Thermoproteota archaeon]|nr:MAG: hypothetical protein DRN96_05765 [Candidatus Korarchaeota archaeon]
MLRRKLSGFRPGVRGRRWYRLSGELEKRENIVFAVVYGSFLTLPVFRDMDMAVYLSEEAGRKLLDAVEYT